MWWIRNILYYAVFSLPSALILTISFWFIVMNQPWAFPGLIGIAFVFFWALSFGAIAIFSAKR